MQEYSTRSGQVRNVSAEKWGQEYAYIMIKNELVSIAPAKSALIVFHFVEYSSFVYAKERLLSLVSRLLRTSYAYKLCRNQEERRVEFIFLGSRGPGI